MRKILIVFGTRPELIKMAPLVKEFLRYPRHFNTKVCVTGQHRQMIDPLLKFFKIKVDFDLNLMKKDQTLEHITSSVLHQVGVLIEKEKIDWMIVQGDTTSAMAAALAGFYKKIKVAHVEAGLRTRDKEHPYPEEINRRIIDGLADVYFAHTPWAKKNLLKEGFKASRIKMTGNTVIDSLLFTVSQKYDFKDSGLEKLNKEKRKIIVITAHRRENMGQPIVNICKAVKEIALEYKDQVVFVYPVHLNPNICKPVFDHLSKIDNVILTKPLDYLLFVHLMKKSYFLLTDSGGLQEEAPSFGKPVLVLRKTTERPEGVNAGCVRVIGMDTSKIKFEIKRLIEDQKHYQRMAKTRNPYGDGKSSRRIVDWFKENV